LNYKIIRNSLHCLKCDEEIVSEHRHDFKWCSCKSIAVDGGKDYLKRCISHNAEYIDTSESESEET
jgi:hypothetical protein